MAGVRLMSLAGCRLGNPSSLTFSRVNEQCSLSQTALAFDVYTAPPCQKTMPCVPACEVRMGLTTPAKDSLSGPCKKAHTGDPIWRRKVGSCRLSSECRPALAKSKTTASSRDRNRDLRISCIAAIPRSTTELKKLVLFGLLQS